MNIPTALKAKKSVGAGNAAELVVRVSPYFLLTPSGEAGVGRAGVRRDGVLPGSTVREHSHFSIDNRRPFYFFSVVPLIQPSAVPSAIPLYAKHQPITENHSDFSLYYSTVKSCFPYRKSLVSHCFWVISCSCSDCVGRSVLVLPTTPAQDGA